MKPIRDRCRIDAVARQAMPARMPTRLAALLLASLLCASALAHAQSGPVVAHDDGPYVRISGNTLTAEWICDGKPSQRTRHLRGRAVTLPPRCAYPDTIRIPSADAPEQAEVVQGVGKLAVISDLHGQFDLAVRLLQANGVIDADRRWIFGRGHLVVVGDCFDRGTRVTEVLWLLYGLQQQARLAGGDVNVVLGNHETMTLQGDLRYLNEKYADIATAMGRPYPALYGEDTVLGRWIRRLPVMLKIDGMLFVHGGISPEYLAQGLDMAAANAAYRGSLGFDKDRVKRDPVLRALYDGKSSPIWYRGYFREDALSDAQVDDLLVRLGVSRIVVGHTSMQRIESRYGGKVIAVDTSIKNGQNGEVLLIEGTRLLRGTLQGERLPLEAD